ncbi:MAG TPA: hypothetical protein VLD67_19705, partial [Vicinamibacterales bacterium]|nr:hypothetical protein [Vicinamibacterales bacterium]
MRMQRAAAGLTALVLATGAGGHAAGSGDDRAREVLAAARKAIGGGKLDALATLSVQAGVQRNAGNFQLNSDVEMLLEMPDKYARMDSIRTPMVAEMRTGFNGDRALQGAGQTAIVGGGAMMIRMGPGAAAHSGKLTPEQQEEANRTVVLTARHELSRLLLGWFGMAHPSLSADYKYYGEAESPDGRADVIEVSGADGFAARLFIDQQTHLPLMVTYQASPPRVMTVGGGSGSGVQVMRRNGQSSD